MIKPRYTREEVVELGEALFKRDVAERLRGRNLRDYVAIDVHSGKYEVDREAGWAIRRLLDRQPGAQFWLRRVGSSVANTFGPRLQFEPPWEP